MLKVLNNEEIRSAWEGAFDEPVDFNHKPTEDELLAIRIKAVAQAQVQGDIDVIKRVIAQKMLDRSEYREIYLDVWQTLTEKGE